MIANFTVDIHADTAQENIHDLGASKEKGFNDLLPTPPFFNLKRADISSSEVPGKCTPGGPSNVKGGSSPKSDDCQMQDEDTHDYGCPIIEEKPSESQVS